MQVIPLQNVPNQTLTVQLDGQNTKIVLYQKNTGLYMDLFLDGGTTLVVCGVLCGDVELLVMDAYLGFVGDLMFNDTFANSNPFWTGLGIRYQLLYIESSDFLPGSLYT